MYIPLSGGVNALAYYIWFSNSLSDGVKRTEVWRCSGQFGKYSDQVPKFLRDRPRDVVKHILNNLREPDPRSAKRVKQVGEGEFMVDGKIRVQFGDDKRFPHCDCSEWRHSRLPCRHFCLIFSCLPEWSWDKLSLLYRESPLLNLDDITLSSSSTEPLSDDGEYMTEANIAEDHEDTVQQQTLPLPPRKRSKTKMLQIHCRTVMKELTSAIYLIKDESSLTELAQGLDGLYAKAKTMMPSEDGVPMEDVSLIGRKKKGEKKSNDAVEQGTKEQSTIIPPPLQAHGAKKHRANGRFGAKTEWQRKLIGQKRKSCGSAHLNQHTPGVKRPSLVTEGPRKKKVKVHAEPGIDSSQNVSPNAPTEEPVSQASSDLPATTQSPCPLGKWSESLFH